jgi:hypothetical protein
MIAGCRPCLFFADTIALHFCFFACLNCGTIHQNKGTQSDATHIVARHTAGGTEGLESSGFDTVTFTQPRGHVVPS